jgi:uncharacterized membrane protein (DUF106 family)
MFQAPVISFWIDIILISIIFAILSKLIQHFTINPKDYFYIKLKSKKINKEMKALANQQNMPAVKEKQKEAFKLVGKQFKLQQKSMLVMLVVAFPIFWFVNKFYNVPFDFGLFTVKSGFWAYVIIGFILSMIISNIYDKRFVKKYYPDGELKE